MSDQSSHGQSRRDFFRTIGRYAILAGLGMGAAAAIAGRAKSRGGETCLANGTCPTRPTSLTCPACPIFQNCGLPQALSAKQAKGQ